MGKRGRKARPLEDRFWEQVDASGDCWEWIGSKYPHGYGRFFIGQGHRVGAHKWSYEYLIGPIAEGLELDHLCRNPACVNPDHLEPVTHRENLDRSPHQVAMQNGRRILCQRGHNDWHTFPSSRQRTCMTCRAESLERRGVYQPSRLRKPEAGTLMG